MHQGSALFSDFERTPTSCLRIFKQPRVLPKFQSRRVFEPLEYSGRQEESALILPHSSPYIWYDPMESQARAVEDQGRAARDAAEVVRNTQPQPERLPKAKKGRGTPFVAEDKSDVDLSQDR